LTNLMLVPPSLPVKTVQEFIDYAKAHPGKIMMASSGNGTTVHLSGELFKAMTGIEMVHVPYRGSAAVYPDLLSGKVHVLFDNLPGALGFVREGKLRALGVTTAGRSKARPDVPTLARTVPGYRAGGGDGKRGAEGHAGGRGRDAQQGGERRAGRSQDAGARRPARRHAHADVGRGVRQASGRRDREVGQGGELRQYLGGVRRSASAFP